MKRNIRGAILIALGLLMLLTAAGILAVRAYRANMAQEHADILLEQLTVEIQSRQEEPVYAPVTEETTSAALPQMTLSGYDLVGILSVESLDMELPILDAWSYDLLQIAPCRYAGSTETDDLIILGHNYKGHFASLKKVSVGDTVTFCDIGGTVHTYEVTATEILEKTQLDRLTETGHDLTIFTCTTGGYSRFVVRCTKQVLS